MVYLLFITHTLYEYDRSEYHSSFSYTLYHYHGEQSSLQATFTLDTPVQDSYNILSSVVNILTGKGYNIVLPVTRDNTTSGAILSITLDDPTYSITIGLDDNSEYVVVYMASQQAFWKN